MYSVAHFDTTKPESRESREFILFTLCIGGNQSQERSLSANSATEIEFLVDQHIDLIR